MGNSSNGSGRGFPQIIHTESIIIQGLQFWGHQQLIRIVLLPGHVFMVYVMVVAHGAPRKLLVLMALVRARVIHGP